MKKKILYRFLHISLTVLSAFLLCFSSGISVRAETVELSEISQSKFMSYTDGCNLNAYDYSVNGNEGATRAYVVSADLLQEGAAFIFSSNNKCFMSLFWSSADLMVSSYWKNGSGAARYPVSSDGFDFITGSSDNSLEQYDPSSGSAVFYPQAHDSGFYYCFFVPAGQADFNNTTFSLSLEYNPEPTEEPSPVPTETPTAGPTEAPTQGPVVTSTPDPGVTEKPPIFPSGGDDGSSSSLDAVLDGAFSVVEFSGHCLIMMVQNPVFLFFLAVGLVCVGIAIFRRMRDTVCR